MIKISNTSKTIATALILFAFFIGFNACKKDYIDYAKLQQEEIDQREHYLAGKYETIDTIVDGNTITGIIYENKPVWPTASGLYYIETKKGDGPDPTPGRIVMTKYEGRLLNDTVFDSNEKFSFVYGTGAVISGWDEAISHMKKGGEATLIIPSSLAYGQNSSGTIPRYSTLVFDMVLLNVQK